jgi:hypothetical protein
MANRKDDVVVTVGGDASGADKAFKATVKGAKDLGASVRNSFGGVGDQLFSLRGAIAGLVGGFSFKAIIDSSIEAQRTAALLEATLRSTGRSSEFTTDQLLEMAGALQKVTTFGDEAIAQAETTLLRFGRVTGQTFEDATRAALDLSIATGQDLRIAAELVGRALQQPDKASRQLRSANILLSKSQTEVLEKLVAQGKTAEAQQIILGKLERAYGGAAEAARGTFGGALTGLKEAAGDLLEGDGGSLEDARRGIEELTATLQSPEVKEGFAVITGGVITLVTWLAKLVSMLGDAARSFGEFAAKVDLNTSRLDKIRLLAQLTNPLTAGKAIREITALGRRPGAGDQERQAPTLPPAAGSGPTGAGGDAGAGDDDEDGETDADRKKAADAAKKRAQAVAAAEAAVFKAQQERQRASLDALNEQNLISVREYHARKLELELAAIDQELAARRKAMATADADEKIRLQGEIEALTTQRTAAVEASAREQAKAEKQLADERLELEERLLEATGRTAEARAAAIEREFGELIKKLKAQGDDAGVAIAVELKGVELARSEFDELERQLDEAQAAYQRRLKEIDTSVLTGARSRSQARRDQIQAAKDLVAEEERLAGLLDVQAAIVGDPALLQRVKDLRQEILITGTIVDETFNQIREIGEDTLGQFFEDIMDDPKNWADAVDDALLSIEKSIQRLIAQRLSEQLVDSLFGGLAGGAGGGSFGDSGLGGLISQGFGALAGAFGGFSSTGTKGHTGALIGTSGTRVKVPAITFADAPRFHGGGMLGQDEVPFIGLKGERVLSREETRDYNNRTSPTMVSVTIQTQDLQSFRRNETEIAARIGDAIRRGQRNR